MTTDNYQHSVLQLMLKVIMCLFDEITVSALLKGLFKKICFSLRWLSLSHYKKERKFKDIIKHFLSLSQQRNDFVISGHPMG